MKKEKTTTKASTTKREKPDMGLNLGWDIGGGVFKRKRNILAWSNPGERERE